jgi:hypothetical protein
MLVDLRALERAGWIVCDHQIFNSDHHVIISDISGPRDRPRAQHSQQKSCQRMQYDPLLVLALLLGTGHALQQDDEESKEVPERARHTAPDRTGEAGFASDEALEPRRV